MGLFDGLNRNDYFEWQSIVIPNLKNNVILPKQQLLRYSARKKHRIINLRRIKGVIMANSNQNDHLMFEVIDPLGYTVYMTEEQWYGHVTTNHPDMTGEADTVKETIVNPNCIYPSSEYNDRNVYFKDRNAKYSKLKYCKVIVEYDDDSKRGEVVTTYKRATISGGIIDGSPKYIKLEL